MSSDLVTDATEFRSGILDCTRFGGDPTGMCFAVCAPLQAYLYMAHQLNTKLIEADFGFSNHVWLELPDGRILDPTADQFSKSGLPAVYLGEMPGIYRRWIKNAAVRKNRGS